MRRIDKTTNSYRVGYAAGVIIAALLCVIVILGILWLVATMAHGIIGS